MVGVTSRDGGPMIIVQEEGLPIPSALPFRLVGAVMGIEEEDEFEVVS